MQGFEELKEAIMKGDEGETAEIVDEMLESGEDPRRIIDEGIITSMRTVGEKFDSGEYFIPDMLVSADASQAALERLEPLLDAEDAEVGKKAVFATVKGDQHDIGKNLALMVFRGAGYRVKDLGTDTPAEEVVEAVKEFDADVVGLSALLTTTMEAQREVIEALEDNGLRDKVLVAVGGAPLTEEFAREIGADVYGDSPFKAVNKLDDLIEK
ncbi:hypothetical protein AKJ65_02110 [candidate division MSBL1 archaeon SCGC-AAA259E19]|uniref:Methyltransferase n=1 Tax=candidate division MSBL1 archaeon SCGC-AAA259E19 TaxID=1698264 RepID=A0A133UMH3_9EURY|nr:hypothetical protein AKJ65_02110 [candidate division MSBL1 archaeon SCGC-AAA259E19]